MTEAQQSAFESLKGKRGDNEAKIAAWYEALGLVGLPATFRKSRFALAKTGQRLIPCRRRE